MKKQLTNPNILKVLHKCCLVLAVIIFPLLSFSQDIPLAEHPRPDFQRPLWQNLNGCWGWQADTKDNGEQQGWQNPEKAFSEKILVPFSWASKLSGIEKPEVNIAWYSREIKFNNPELWNGKDVYLVFGAIDFHTKVWINGEFVGEHKGGYTPFEFTISPFLKGDKNILTVRVEDVRKEDRPFGKQGYGDAKGIWQTVYLESRDKNFIKSLHFVPDIDNNKVEVRLQLAREPETATTFQLKGKNNSLTLNSRLEKGKKDFRFVIDVSNPVLWDLDNPFLYEVTAMLASEKLNDQVDTYFGMRKVSSVEIPGKGFWYVALNNKPFYMKLTLDQAYHPEGFYTYPSDRFMKEEILRAKDLGLNGIRIHIKTEIPRKLYWADKMGLLVMADVPNFWGNPTDEARANWEYTAINQLERDFNHPSIFSWVIFNETWGLFTKTGDKKKYLPETQEWVAGWYHKFKEADPTRLVEDNSPCNEDHVVTDLNTWHSYTPARLWAERLDGIVKETYPGSTSNYIGGNKQTAVPMFNSECGAVWGYKGSTGDIDMMWEYHIMMNEFRKRPKVAGFLFTEFHDVTNEWNGYYRYDRSIKDFGLDELCPGMTINDLHQDIIPIIGDDFFKKYEAGQTVDVPLYISAVANEVSNGLKIKYILHGWDSFGNHKEFGKGEMDVSAEPISCRPQAPVTVQLPGERALLILSAELINAEQKVISRNFLPLDVRGKPQTQEKSISVELLPASYSSAEWTIKQASPQQGKKVWGMGAGYFEYTISIPENLKAEDIERVEFAGELAARKPQAKYLGNSDDKEHEWDSKNVDPGRSQNSYPMTDEDRFSSSVEISFDGQPVSVHFLADDPADHRGMLSWMNQKPGSPWLLDEPGSHGYLVRASLDGNEVSSMVKDGKLVVRLAVTQAGTSTGGLSVYGDGSGRYPFNPRVTFKLK